MITAVNRLVQDWISPITCTIRNDQLIREALSTMKDKRISALPVVDDRGIPVGIITIGDFARTIDETDQLLDSNYPHFDDCLWVVDLVLKRFGSDPVSTLMSEILTIAHPNQSMREAAKVMCESRLHHLLVCHGDGTLAGVLSASDFVRFVKETME